MTVTPASFLKPGERLVLVSNRLPVVLSQEGGSDLSIRMAAGGLATGLGRPHREGGGPWIGWPGIVTPNGVIEPSVKEVLAQKNMVGVGLDPEEHEHYYTRTSNRCIWPLFHYFKGEVEFHPESWEAYVAVNRRFAEVTLENLRPGDLVFVQDFHLTLVPAMLREARPDLRIGFFLHIPFPSSEIYRILPRRAEVLRGLLGADVIGFHTLDYVRHFRSSVQRVLGIEAGSSMIQYGDRRVRLMAQPLGIDAEEWVARAHAPETGRELAELHTAAAGRRVILGVDRLDYTKGIPARLLAFREFLRRDPTLVERVMMIQIAVPSRVEVEEYRDLKREVDRLAGEVNSEFGRPGLQPLHYQYRGVSAHTLSALYQVADVAMVTPLRDGLNLVAKEFVASRRDDNGVLVIGEFTGAAWELGEALQVNPFDLNAMADGLSRAIEMSKDEQAERMRPMRERVLRKDVHLWAGRCVDAIRGKDLEREPTPFEGDTRNAWLEQWREAKSRILFLDYDGTLREFTERPEQAVPDPELLKLLSDLNRAGGVEVWVVSGRPPRILADWLGETGIGLIAEHGAMLRAPGESEFMPLFGLPHPSWKQGVLEVMQTFVDRVPNSLIEEKPFSAAWHYRASDPRVGSWQAAELGQHLSEILANLPLEVMSGNKVVEVRPQGVDKGSAVIEVLRDRMDREVPILAAGDDRTDEDLFQRLPGYGLSLLVGKRESAATHRLDSPQDLRALLGELLTILEASAPRPDSVAGGVG